MGERRIAFTIGVTYETPLEKLRALPAWLRSAVQQAIHLAIFEKLPQEGVQFAYPTCTLYVRQESAAGH